MEAAQATASATETRGQYQRIATRYEKRAVNYKALLLIAAILL